MRFVDNQDGTITDTVAGLMLPKTWFFDRFTWDKATKRIEELNQDKYLKYSDWVLPSVKQFVGLFDYTQYAPVLPLEHPFLNAWSHHCYWSSSVSDFNTDCAWFVRILNGNVDYDYKVNSYYVLPVRKV